MQITITKSLKYFLAGFIEGEGSLTVSIKKNSNARFNYCLDPEFFLYQHQSGLPLLETAQTIFGSGRIYLKSGSKNVFVYAISNRRVIYERVLPFFKEYINPYSCRFTQQYDLYEIILTGLLNKEHLQLQGFLYLLELCYKLNSFKGKQRKRTFLEIRDEILRDYTSNCKLN